MRETADHVGDKARSRDTGCPVRRDVQPLAHSRAEISSGNLCHSHHPPEWSTANCQALRKPIKGCNRVAGISRDNCFHKFNENKLDRYDVELCYVCIWRLDS